MKRARGWTSTVVAISALFVGYLIGTGSLSAYAAEYQVCGAPISLSPVNDGSGFNLDLSPGATVTFPNAGTGNVFPLQGNSTTAGGFPLDLGGASVVPVGSPSSPNVTVTFPAGGRVTIPLPAGGRTIHVIGKSIRAVRSK